MKVFNQVFLSLVLMLSSLGQVAQGAIDPGQAYFNQGNFEQAIGYWEGVLSKNLLEDNPKLYIDTSLRLAKAYQALGRMWEAYEVLNDTLDLCEGEESYRIRAEVFMQLSDFYVEMRNFNKNRGSCEMKDVVNTAIGNKELDIAPSAMLNSASDYLNKALANLLEKDSLLKAKILNRHGNILILQEKSVEGLSLYEKALGILAGNDEQEAKLLRVKIKLNLLQTAIIDSNKNDSVLNVEIDALQVTISSSNNDEEKFKINLNNLCKSIYALDSSHDKNFALIGLAQLTKKLFYGEKKEIFDKEAFDKKGKLFVHALLNNALEAAKKQQDQRSRIYALFELAKLYGLDKRYQDSISLLREAIFHTQDYQRSSENPDILYRLEWKLIEYLNLVNSKNHQQVIEGIYKNAAKHMEDMEDTYTVLPKDFNKQKEKLFFEYADFLLKKAYRMLDVTDKQKDAKQKVLKDAIEVIEFSKVAEVKDYLQDSCLTKELEEQIEHLDDNLPSNVAIFYPLLFEDRIESLMITKENRIAQNIYEHTDIKAIEDTIKNFRTVASFDGNNGSRYKTDVYNWFRESIEKLNGIDTIVIAPHGMLYNVPFAALCDNCDNDETKPYLIEQYALNITSTIDLTNIKKLFKKHSGRMLASGVSIVKDENLPRLCYAATEVMNVTCAYHNQQTKILNDSNCLNERFKDCDNNFKSIRHSTYSELNNCFLKQEKGLNIDNCMLNTNILLEQEFTIEKLQYLMLNNNFSNIHISTHGKFQSNSKKAFLYTSDGKNINMPELRKAISKKETKELPYLDLLVLSACQTATGEGSGRSAFGFASSAISAGVSTVVGTLWPVHEKATNDLMTYFYTNLYGNNSEQYTKAKALQNAVIKVLRDSERKNEDDEDNFSDPYYWAPIVMIGSGYK